MRERARSWYVRPAARSWRTSALDDDVAAFHRSLDGYEPSPLIELPRLASELGVGRLFVKDESHRLGLPAFKILGASYAVSRAMSERCGGSGRALPLRELISRLRSGSELRLVAATDGNHGRAVAHVARLLGLRATIYFPSGVTQEAKDGIASEGAETVEVDAPYDDVVMTMVAAAADRGPDVLIIQDTSWPGYADVPQWIVDGYETLVTEIDDQLADASVDRLDLVAVPAGVGSLAQAVVRHYRATSHAPSVLVVEPDAAPTILASLLAGQLTTVQTGRTIMNGLNCGTPSTIAWPVLRDGADAAITVSDGDAARAMNDLDQLGVDSGPCGAATLAAARAALQTVERRDALGVGAGAVVVLISTEGRAANPPAAVADTGGGSDH